MRGLEGRTYIVTGAASGIGLATAARLLAEGARVVGADLAPSDEAGAAARGAGSSPTSTWRTRTRSRRSCEPRWSSAAPSTDWSTRRRGRRRPGAHAAGRRMGPRHPVNLTGTYLTAKHVIGQMLSQPGQRRPARLGGDGGQHRGARGHGGRQRHSASKGGVVLLTKNMAIDYAGRGIRVNAVCPGFIETPMTASIFGPGMEAALADIVHEHKLGRRMGRPRRSPRWRPSSSPTTPRS